MCNTGPSPKRLTYVCRFGTTEIHFAKIAEKNHTHSVNNPYAQFQTKCAF